MAKNRIRVQLQGQGLAADFHAISYEIMGLPAGTYIKFIMEDGGEVIYNDFGIRQIRIDKL